MSADKKPNTEALRHGENKKSLKQGGGGSGGKKIAAIARNRRNRKGKTLPLMNADHADRKRKEAASSLRLLLYLVVFH
jgi:hypothetical protein